MAVHDRRADTGYATISTLARPPSHVKSGQSGAAEFMRVVDFRFENTPDAIIVANQAHPVTD